MATSMPMGVGRATSISSFAGSHGSVGFANRPAGFSSGGVSGGPASYNPAAFSQAYASGVHFNPATTNANPAFTAARSRPTNAWSIAAPESASGAQKTSSSSNLYQSNGATSNRFSGQHLDNSRDSGTASNNRYAYRNGGDHYRHWRSNYYYGYPYGPVIAYGDGYPSPYYGPVFDADSTGDSADAPAAAPAPAASAQMQPAPAPQTDAAVASTGPDSLVEAVQQELSRRGYFAGKIDAMYGADTKEALRRFQNDNHLAATGLINEATLHILQLD